MAQWRVEEDGTRYCICAGPVEEWMQLNCARSPEDIVGWEAWYEDGSRYRSDSHAADDLPDTGFQMLKVWYRDKHSKLRATGLRGNDRYWLPGASRYKEGSWVASDVHDRQAQEWLDASW